MKRYGVLITALTVLLTLLTGCRKAASPKPEDTSYAGGLFDASRVHTIDIHFLPGDWEDLLENAEEKTKYKTEVIIDGETVPDVSCSAKGNSSLKMVQELYGIDRYSLKLNFGKYIKEQTYHGIKKLNLNNRFSDSTCMKDYLCYTMFRKAGADAPLCSYAWVTVNDLDYGLFLIVEEVDEAFLERTGRKGSVLYKPDSKKLDAAGKEHERVIKNGIQAEDYSEGAELGYRGDSVEDYPDIFSNAETDSNEEDKLRVIRALKGLSEGKDLNQYLDTEELVRYFAVQNYVLNLDGYTGSYLHNYYLCEKDGRLGMLPWDYNTSFGAFLELLNPGFLTSTQLANYGIDTPLLGSTPEQRPMWKWIADNETYKENYHQAIDQFLKTYFESGEFEREIDSLQELLLPYIEKDPTSFTSPERFTSSVKTLRTFCLLRAESVRRQLDGKLSADTECQKPEDQVDASAVTIEDLS